MSLRETFLARHPEIYLLHEADPAGLHEYMTELGWLHENERVVAATKGGEGNMNYTLRVWTTARSVILKQARPWVEKYPEIPAPWDRALVEGRFYEAIASDPELSCRMPALLGLDRCSRTLALEDLGPAQDFSSLYAGEQLASEALDQLLAYLSRLHARFGPQTVDGDLANRAMRELNHEHIFSLPLRAANGLDLDRITPGLQAAAARVKANRELVARAAQLGELYLADGPSLVHGDFFPGSWLRTTDGVKVIDPEFCFFGPQEFDLGVLLAHLVISSQPEALLRQVVAKTGQAPAPHATLVYEFAGIEIMRRLIGVAQLPTTDDLARRSALLERATRMVVTPEMEAT